MSVVRTYAVDMGASGIKCFVGTFDDAGFKLEEIYRFEHETADFFIPDSSGNFTQRTYWDDIYIYNNVIKGLKRYRKEVSDKLNSIGIDTWGTDGQFINEDGDMISKIYCYRDHRLDNMVDRIMAKIDKRLIYQITGIHFQPFNLSNQLLWFVENRGYMLKLNLKFLLMSTVFYYYLGGVVKVDSTLASVTQLMDARKRVWSEKVFKTLGIPIDIMPEIVDPGTIVGKLSDPLGEFIGLKDVSLIAVGSHDTASAFAAAPVENIDDALIISSGTWSLIGKLVPEPITSDEAMEANLSNEGGIGNIRLLKNCMGTWLVQELLRKWADEDGRKMSWDEVLNLTRKAEPFTSFIDPDDSSFYNPPDMEEAIKNFCRKTGQRVPSDRGTILRVVYESLAMKYRYINEQIERVTGKKNRVLHIVGGGSKNVLLNQFAADSTGLRVLAGPDEATASGNCMVQAMGLGVVKDARHSIDLIREAFKIEEYEPKNVDRWTNAYSMFKTLVNP